MLDRRSMLQTSTAFGVLTLPAVAGGGEVAYAANGPTALLPDPATTPVPSPPFPKNLTKQERAQLKTFDELDFEVFNHADWARLGESHARNIRVHWPDGHFTDGMDKHVQDQRPVRLGPGHPHRNSPDPDLQERTDRRDRGHAGHLHPANAGRQRRLHPPNNKKYAINMSTIGIWNKRGVMDEEFLF